MIDPSRPEGFFWMAANMGTLAESYGLRQGIKYRGAIKDALETVLTNRSGVSEGIRGPRARPLVFQGAGAVRRQQDEIGRAPAQVADTTIPNSTASHYFLAETLFEMNRDAEARAELQKVIAAPIDPEWAAEDRDFKEKAAKRLVCKIDALPALPRPFLRFATAISA